MHYSLQSQDGIQKQKKGALTFYGGGFCTSFSCSLVERLGQSLHQETDFDRVSFRQSTLKVHWEVQQNFR